MKTRYLLLAIVLLAAILRFWQIQSNPPSLTWDEVAWGYNAYALGIDGKDEFGRFLPLDYLESFGDFKPVLYAYLAVLPIKLLGLTEFAVRLPSALFGVLTVLITYFLTKRIFTNAHSLVSAETVALLATFFLAISPWHVNLSRAAFEANVASFFIVTGVWLFLLWIDKRKSYFLIMSAISFVLSIYTFNTARVVAPLLVVLLTASFLKTVLARKKDVFISSIIAIFFLFPIIGFLFTPQAGLRFHEVNIFTDIGVIERTNQEMANDGNAVWSRIIHNRRLAYTVEFLKHYFDHFNPSFLFIRGDGNPKFSTQDVGQLYLWDLPFFIIGILFLIKLRIGRWWLVFLWLLLGIVPAATARETPHALRIEASLPTFQVLIAFGVAVFLSKASMIRSNFRKAIVSCAFFLLFVNLLYYLHGYYAHFPREYSGEWQYGYKEAISYIREVEKEYDFIYTSTELGRPHMYYAFYLPIDPNEYRSSIVVTREEPFGIVHVERVNKYFFAKNVLDASSNNGSSKILYIDSASNVPPKANIIRTFSLLNGRTALIAYIATPKGEK